MFAVVFEVHPKADRWDAYRSTAAALRPELEQVEGFVDNLRYRSLTRDGWILSLSTWRDEKAVVRWRTTAQHHAAQEKGRSAIFSDYHLRVGEVIRDTRLPAGHALAQQRFDETIVGQGTTLTLLDARRPATSVTRATPETVAAGVGLDAHAEGLVSWDIFDAVLTPGDLVLLLTWRERASAEAFERAAAPREATRLRQIRVVRDYGMWDRREAPQFYPEVAGGPSRP